MWKIFIWNILWTIRELAKEKNGSQESTISASKHIGAVDLNNLQALLSSEIPKNMLQPGLLEELRRLKPCLAL